MTLPPDHQIPLTTEEKIISRRKNLDRNQYWTQYAGDNLYRDHVLLVEFLEQLASGILRGVSHIELASSVLESLKDLSFYQVKQKT